MEAFDLERCGNATMALGQAAGALEDVIAYVQERKQFGKALVEFQAVQLARRDADEGRGGAPADLSRGGNAEDGLPSVLDSSLGKCFANESRAKSPATRCS